MFAKVHSAGLLGIEAYGVTVEVDAGLGLPGFAIIGRAANEVKESGVRVRSALTHSGFKLPPRKFTVNLAPAGVRKDGSAFDLPIAVGMLAAMELLPRPALEGVILLGELALDGQLRRVPGALPVALHARSAGVRAVVMPAECAAEAAAVSELPVYAAASLADVAAYLRGEVELPRARCIPRVESDASVDFSDVRGLDTVRRAVEVAAAGGHNLLLIGPPGCGKSMIARRFPTVLAPLDEREAIETTAVYSAAGKLEGASLLQARPYRAPHHDISIAGLIGGGGGYCPRPGEISLAHHGVLFLDELLEFRRSVLEAMRQPLEERRVTIVRANASVTYPASCALVVALNPCPCGYRGSSLRGCVCAPISVQRYLARLSGPLLDRIDLHVEVPHVDYRALQSDRDGEPSAAIRERVLAAQAAQRRRRRGHPRYANAQLGSREVRHHCRLDATADRQLEACQRRFGLSTRAVQRVLRVARTVADLAGRERIAPADVAEAIALRALDREAVAA